MREPLRDKSRLEHMLGHIEKVLNAAEGKTFAEFNEDPILFGAIAYYTMIIGEAAYMLTKEFKDLHPSTPWRQIEGMRHHIVHGYAQIRKDMLWNVVQEDLRPLKAQLTELLSATDWDEWEKTKSDI
ncbi:MAG: DUF86 domain-containing protein [Bacteroidaceae bacterium]|nr:DUF86 domain-containing protein [Bacteroidaceae bacterium]